jgi:pyrimidine-nucleoside phosphorylase
VTTYRTVQRKRDGEELEPAEIAAFLIAYQEGRVADYQMAAFLMAVFIRGMTSAELNAMVDVMLHSGEVVDLSSVEGTKVDKHSTGGVGDKVSIVLAPLVASLGVPVPMMSGRGLGHSGGTVDKLESIPGFRTGLTLAEYRAQMERVGCALIAQTDEVAPLDRKLYALRDVTATVESIPLIASSIMSKKLAEGIDALVLDVKVGNGAFLPEESAATELARTMIEVGEAHGRSVVARMTAMDRPLGHAVGNALEIAECVQALRGGGPPDLREVTVELAAEMLVLGGASPDLAAGREQAATALNDGRALEKMHEIIMAQGGDARVLDEPVRLPRAAIRRDILCEKPGIAGVMDVRAIGHAAVALGAGRSQLGAAIDPAVGLDIPVKPGDPVERGERIATIYAQDEASAAAAAATLREAIPVGAAKPATLPLIGKRLTGAAVTTARAQ